VRRGILAGAGLLTEPARTPLKPRLTGVRRHEGYTTRNLAFESFPGFFVTGTLYLPEGDGPFAGVLLPHGHFRGDTPGRFHPDVQLLGAALARAGAVVLAYDMVGWGECRQYPHDKPLSLALQLWNSRRALDYLESRPDVDRRRLAVTGASGGATQSFLLAAVDERVAAVAPVVQVSAYFFGGCACESGLPIHVRPGGRTNNAEIAALAAPRPQLVVSNGQDWTKHTPEIGFPYIRRAYAALGAADAVELVHLPAEGHDLGPSKRAAVEDFLRRRLGLRQSPPAAGRPVTIEAVETQKVFTAASPRPATALATPEAVEAAFARR
jgi:predicted alpha/beta-hydrolase family hydrolase